jgi:hypothetical protein
MCPRSRFLPTIMRRLRQKVSSAAVNFPTLRFNSLWRAPLPSALAPCRQDLPFENPFRPNDIIKHAPTQQRCDCATE